MSVGADGPYDLVLQDRETNPKVELGLVLQWVQENATDDVRKVWSEDRVEPLSPRFQSGPLHWTHKDPISDSVFAQQGWEHGAFKPYYEEGDRRYAKSDGVDLRWKGVAALGPRRSTPRYNPPVAAGIRSNFILANGDFEEGLTGGWTAGSGAAHTVEVATVRTGTYAANVVVAQGTGAGDIISQTLESPIVWRGITITVIAYVGRSSGSDSGVLLRIADSAGSNDSATITASGYNYVVATRTINPAATSVTISIRHSATTSNATHTFLVDDINVVPAGGITCAGFAVRGSTDPDEIYAAVGRGIYYWDESDLRWSLGFMHGSVVTTDIEEFNNTIYVGFGNSSTGDEYRYGSTTSWTTAALNATANHQDNYITYMVKALNGYGNWSLWKSGPSTPGGIEVHAIYFSEDPTNNWGTSTAFTVGSSSRAITGLHEFNNSFVVSKVDGIWIWEGGIYDFINITQEWEHSADAENGRHGQFWNGALYLSSIRQGFHRLTNNSLSDLSDLLMAPRLTDFGGKVTAMTACARELILSLDQPTADATVGKTSRLVAFNIIDGEIRVHTLHEPAIGRIDAMSLHKDTRLWCFGRSYDSNLDDYFLSSVMVEYPDKIAAPYADVTPSIESSGYFDTSIWNGGLPETNKAFIAITIWCEDVDEDHTIQVDFGADGRAANNIRVGTFRDTGLIQTLFFKNIEDPQNNATGHFVQLRFTLSTNSTVSPKLYAFALHTQLAPPPVKRWDVVASVGDKTRLRTNVAPVETKASMRSLFEELETQVFPLTLLEDFGQAHDGSTDGAHAHQVRLVTFRRQPTSSDEFGEELWYLRIQEVPVDG